MEIDPAELGIDSSVRAAPFPAELRKAGGAGEDTVTFDTATAAQAAAQYTTAI
ncbi:MAG: hypothetical protein ACREV4_00320 [Gammaproteobacteria bacterium]